MSPFNRRCQPMSTAATRGTSSISERARPRRINNVSIGSLSARPRVHRILRYFSLDSRLSEYSQTQSHLTVVSQFSVLRLTPALYPSPSPDSTMR